MTTQKKHINIIKTIIKTVEKKRKNWKLRNGNETLRNYSSALKISKVVFAPQALPTLPQTLQLVIAHLLKMKLMSDLDIFNSIKYFNIYTFVFSRFYP